MTRTNAVYSFPNGELVVQNKKSVTQNKLRSGSKPSGGLDIASPQVIQEEASNSDKSGLHINSIL